MKAIKDCEWEVRIDYGNNKYWWSSDHAGSGVMDISMNGYAKTEKEAKARWLSFAKANKIKKWRFV